MTEQFNLLVNYNKIIESEDLRDITRQLALFLKAKDYITVGDFLQHITKENLIELSNMIEEKSDDAHNNLILITEMLSQAEGIETNTIDQLTKRTNTFITLVTITQLHWRKLVNVYYENMTLGDDCSDKVVVESI
jgi:hypothetical protein